MFAFLGHTTDTKLVIKSNNNTPKVNDFLSAWLAEHDRTQRDATKSVTKWEREQLTRISTRETAAVDNRLCLC